MAPLWEEKGRNLESYAFVPLLDSIERNRRSFENIELLVQILKFLFSCSLVSWSKSFIESSPMS